MSFWPPLKGLLSWCVKWKRWNSLIKILFRLVFIHEKLTKDTVRLCAFLKCLWKKSCLICWLFKKMPFNLQIELSTCHSLSCTFLQLQLLFQCFWSVLLLCLVQICLTYFQCPWHFIQKVRIISNVTPTPTHWHTHTHRSAHPPVRLLMTSTIVEGK